MSESTSKPKTFNNIRQTQLTDTADNWNNKGSFVPEKGELVIIQGGTDLDTKSSQIKVGDGESTLSELFPISGGGGNGGSSLQLDTSLTKEGYAADAKAVGDKFDNYATKQDVQDYVNNSILGGKW